MSDIDDLISEMNLLKDEVCPNCGRCPTCGRQQSAPWVIPYDQPWVYRHVPNLYDPHPYYGTTTGTA